MQSKEKKGNMFLNKVKNQTISNKQKTIKSKAISFSKTKPNSPKVGDICNLIVTALGPKNIGIDEFSYGYSILIPNAKLGEKVKAQIIKKNLNKAKYAVAKIIMPNSQVLHKAKLKSLDKDKTFRDGSAILEDGKEKINVGDILTVKLNKIAIQTDNSCIGIVNSDFKLPIKYQFIIPNIVETKVGQEIQIQVTKMKLKYGFALMKSSVVNSDQVKPNIKQNLGTSNKLPATRLNLLSSPQKAQQTNPLVRRKGVYPLPPTVAYPTALAPIKPLEERGKQQGINGQIWLTKLQEGAGKTSVIAPSHKESTNLLKPFISLSSRPSEAYVFGTSLSKIGFPSLNIPKVQNYGQKITPNNSSFSSFISGSLADLNKTKKTNYKPFNVAKMTKGSKITLTLPKTAKKYAKYLVINILNQNIETGGGLVISSHPTTLNDGKTRYNSYILFIKNVLRAKLGDKVRVKFTKIGSSFAIGEVIRISPNSSFTKLARVRKNLNEMLVNGMHYGEKVVKCQAKMRNFIWNRKKISFSPLSATYPLNSNSYKGSPVKARNFLAKPWVQGSALKPAKGSVTFAGKSLEALKQGGLVNTNSAGSKKSYSFGTRGPKQKVLLTMRSKASETEHPKELHRSPLEASKNQSLNKGVALIKKGRHLINLLKTRRCLNIGLNQLTKYAAKGRTFLFVGTKKPAAGLIARAALFSKTSFFVNTRWLGGMLTNWKTIIKSISKIRPILKEKQKVISNILQKRSKIQNRLLKKVFSLRKKSKLLIKKGKQLIAKVKIASVTDSVNNKNSFAKLRLKLNQINLKRKELFEKGQSLLEKRQNLLNKQKELKEKTLNIKENGFLIANKYKVLLTQLRTTHTKLHDLRLLFSLNKQLRQIKKLAKDQGKNKFILSYGKFKQLTTLATEKNNQGTLFTSSNQASHTLDGSPLFNGNKSQDIKNFNTDFINSKKFWLIPNPPQEILNKLLSKINYVQKTSFLHSKPKDLSSPTWQQNRAPLGGEASKAKFTKQAIGDKTKLKKQAELTVKKTSFLNSMACYAYTKGVWGYATHDTLAADHNQFSIKEKNTTSLLKESKLIILTKLLSKFSRFLPYIKNCINLIKNLMQNIEKKIMELKINLKYLKKTLTDYLLLNNKINSELELIKTKYLSEQQIIRVLRRKLKRHEAEKKLLQFLPKLRYLPTPKSQISVAIQLLMKRFVDPKMKYPLDLIYDQASLRKKSKKVAAARKKKWQRLETYFGGIANMTKLKKTQIAKNVAIIIGQQEEINAIRECKKLGIKMFHIVDTNCNPGLADHFIPANDDSRNSIKYLLSKMVTRIRLAQKIRLRLKKK
nr:ribosomal protein S2 [Chloromonas rosae]